MLVTLGNNVTIGANSQQTFTYSPSSVQKVFIKVDDTATNYGVAINVTIQLGSRTVVNGVSMYGLLGYTQLVGGFHSSSTDTYVAIDLGSWQLMNGENLQVTISSTAEMTAVDVSAIVDTPGELNPVQYTSYSDNVFTAERVMSAIAYSASATETMDEDSGICTIRNDFQSSSPTFISGNGWYRALSKTNDFHSNYSLMMTSLRPLDTSFNYPTGGTADEILVAQSIRYTPAMLAQAKASRRISTAYAS